MKNKWKTYAFYIILPLAVGAAAAWLTKEGQRIYSMTVRQPPLSPPPEVFPIVWGALYLLMGIGAARVALTEATARRNRALLLFFLQLAINFFWSIIFFNAHAFGFALIWLLLLWTAALLMTLSFRKSDTAAAVLQLPYMLWLSFAAWLNLGVWYLNK